jgi:type II secretory pathway pseudopilin PulG
MLLQLQACLMRRIKASSIYEVIIAMLILIAALTITVMIVVQVSSSARVSRILQYESMIRQFKEEERAGLPEHKSAGFYVSKEIDPTEWSDELWQVSYRVQNDSGDEVYVIHELSDLQP